jgi:ketosteroid isomerase-like protein
MNTTDRNIEAVLNIFRAIEEREVNDRNMQPFLQLVQPDVELCWPPSLPYGGSARGWQQPDPSWADIWDPLQPTPAERRMNPRVIAANDRNEVVVLYCQRGVNNRGEHFDTEVLGVYKIREGKLSRAQMFYFDEAGTNRFLATLGHQCD